MANKTRTSGRGRNSAHIRNASEHIVHTIHRIVDVQFDVRAAMKQITIMLWLVNVVLPTACCVAVAQLCTRTSDRILKRVRSLPVRAMEAVARPVSARIKYKLKKLTTRAFHVVRFFALPTSLAPLARASSLSNWIVAEHKRNVCQAIFFCMRLRSAGTCFPEHSMELHFSLLSLARSLSLCLTVSTIK